MKLMVELIGGQNLPNLLPVRHFRPEKVLLVYTNGTRTQYQRLQPLLQPDTAIESLETDAYDIHGINSQLNMALQRLQVQRDMVSTAPTLLFNLTGGTKSMVIAAYQVAAQYNAPICYLQSEGKQSTIYYYSWQDQQLYLQDHKHVPEYLTLREILDLHFGQGEDLWKEKGPSKGAGGLFEYAIAQALRAHGYEVMTGLKAQRDQLDIDVVIRYQNQIGIIEAKIGNGSKSTKGIQQLSTAAHHLGTYTRQFLVTNKPPEISQQVLRDALKITPIPLLHYEKGMETLTPEDEQTLLAAIDSSMKAGLVKA